MLRLAGGSINHGGGEGYVEFGSIGEPSSAGRTLGTFAGVFSPVTLSMFSALLFLRIGYLVGNAGLLTILVQFIIAYGILVFTVTSICAMCTNGAVEGGGAYFMISRTLGPEFGGSIGTLFFLANIVSSGLYIVGCVEGLVENFGPSGLLVGEGNSLLPDSPGWRFFYCTLLNILNLLVCLVGATLFAKTSVVIFAVVLICTSSSVISFFVQSPMNVTIPDENHFLHNMTGNGTMEPVYRMYTGLSMDTLVSNLYANYTRDYTNGVMVSFSSVFGVLFSGVTGIMAGANMSGELKDPGRSIPRGTLSAVGFTMLTYFVLSVLTAASCSRELLQNQYIFLMPINIWRPFITIGIITATASASLSNLIGSSRVLQALAKDNIFGRILKIVSDLTWSSNPLAAVLVAWGLVQVILLIGSLNVIAQINSVLFLLSYVAMNLACLGLDLASAPNFRPSFKYFSWHTALIGVIGCVVMMFVINPIYALCSFILCILLILLLHVFSPAKSAEWGSISQALIFHQVRKYLLMLDSRKDHVKFWRPQMLLMVSNPRSSAQLIYFVNQMKKSGLYVLGHVKAGQDFSEMSSDPTQDEYTHWLSLVDHLEVKAFVELTVARTVREGLHHLVRISGMGAMKPNTIVFGFYDSETPPDFLYASRSLYASPHYRQEGGGDSLFPLRAEGAEGKAVSPLEYVHMMNDVLRMRRNLCVCRHFNTWTHHAFWTNTSLKYIDVWPINFFNPSVEDPFTTTCLFLMQLACVINMKPRFKHFQLRVLLCDDMKHSQLRLEHLLTTLRIDAFVQLVPEWNDRVRAQWSVNVSDDYLASVNTMIRDVSGMTACTFVSLPELPPQPDSFISYLNKLTLLTDELPPAVLVYGINAVTSTAL
uniref:Solute carrier family 12 member 9 n=1 Tax=Cacopsylla melanoneura TaxID=428564 RepID=A0A8D8U144_9HEMI